MVFFAKPCHGLMQFAVYLQKRRSVFLPNKKSINSILKRVFPSHPSLKGLLLDQLTLDGHAQMAADSMMLEKVKNDSDLALLIRFYIWGGPWVSIGYNQKKLPSRWTTLIKEKKIRVTRRPSGGGAVLHSGGLTYSLAWKSPPFKKQKAYAKINQWLISAFKELGINLKLGLEKSRTISENCFASTSQADLIDDFGCKRVGSAQFWNKGSVLQHGEIVINPDESLWLEVFKTEPPKAIQVKNLEIESLRRLLIKNCFSSWDIFQWENANFSEKEIKEIIQNSKNYFL